jgi:hypothetical protein
MPITYLYHSRYKDLAKVLLDPFGYGPEFIRLNFDALEAYSACSSSVEVCSIESLLLFMIHKKYLIILDTHYLYVNMCVCKVVSRCLLSILRNGVAYVNNFVFSYVYENATKLHFC